MNDIDGYVTRALASPVAPPPQFADLKSRAQRRRKRRTAGALAVTLTAAALLIASISLLHAGTDSRSVQSPAAPAPATNTQPALTQALADTLTPILNAAVPSSLVLGEDPRATVGAGPQQGQVLPLLPGPFHQGSADAVASWRYQTTGDPRLGNLGVTIYEQAHGAAEKTMKAQTKKTAKRDPSYQYKVVHGIGDYGTVAILGEARQLTYSFAVGKYNVTVTSLGAVTNDETVAVAKAIVPTLRGK